MLKVFLVDDEKDIRLGLKTILQRDADCVIVGEASDGREALGALTQVNPDVLITDIKMPVMDGIELTKSISNAGLNVKVVALSGYDEYKYVREAMKVGAVDYLLKPVDKAALIELLEKISEKIEGERIKKHQIESFSQKIYDNLEIISEKFLIDLIRGNGPDSKQMESLKEFGCLFSDIFLFTLIRTDGMIRFEKQMYDKFSISSNNSLKEQLKKLLPDTFHGCSFILAEYKGKLGMLITVSKDLCETFLQNLHIMLNILRDELLERTGLGFTAGISTVYHKISETSVAYHQAAFALQEGFYNNTEKILTYSREKSIYNDLAEAALTDSISSLSNSIELGDVINTRRKIEAIFNLIKNYKVSPDRCRELLRFVILRICATHQEFRQVVENCTSDEFDLIYHIEKEDTFGDLLNYLNKALCSMLQYINNERLHRSKKIIEIVKDYIHSHYSQEISLKCLADYVHLSPNYLSDLFKNEVGKNYIDYLIEVRINAAKKFLSQHDIKVYEVGHRVGYDDPASFNRAFKKIVSVSPAEYKKLIK